MGYLQTSQSRRKKRQSEGHFNYIDRVRVREPNNFSGPGRGSGWRQRSLSSIDLSSNSSRSRDYSSGLYDLYTRVDSGRDYEDFYAVNHKASRKSDSIYDHVDPHLNINGVGVEACSLRRTRSLAVIREETFNDLQISGVRTRRSQLIPRAKLVERNFFQDRFKVNRTREEDSGSNNTQTSQESDEFYANLKCLDSSSHPTNTWQTDKSDLDSLDSSYFKNSSHQASLEIDKNQLNDRKTQADIHCEQTVLAETTTSNSDLTDNCGEIDEDKTDSASFQEIKYLDEILQSEDEKGTLEKNTFKWLDDSETISQNLSSDPEEPPDYNQKSKLVIELPSDLSKFKDDLKSVVSYDSIYLSSEASDHQTAVDEKVIDNNHDITVSTDNGTIHIKVEDYDELINKGNIEQNTEDTTEISLDTLYSQVNKTKPKIVAIEPKISATNLTTFSDISNRGTLERLTLLTTSRLLHESQELLNSENLPQPPPLSAPSFNSSSSIITATTKSHSSPSTNLPENQYCSLPDVNIGKSLRASERIDAKLRLSCGIEEEKSIYDSISRFGRAHKRLRQRENCEIVVLNPISIDELPREAPSIEVVTPIKEVEDLKTQDFLSQLGLDSADYCNSLETFSGGSDQECSLAVVQQVPFTVNIGGRKVIVDEIDKLQLEEENRQRNSLIGRSNSLRDNDFFKENIEAKNSEIKIVITDANGQSKDDIGYLYDITASNSANCEKQSLSEYNSDDDLYNNPKEFIKTDDLFNARPVKVIDEVKALNDRTNTSQDFIKSRVIKTNPKAEMPRPQILHIIESSKHPKEGTFSCSHGNKTINGKNENVTEINSNNNTNNGKDNNIHESQQEFHEKVDSIRCYWSKLVINSDTDSNNGTISTGTNNNNNNVEQEKVADSEEQKENLIKSVEDLVKTIEEENGHVMQKKDLQKYFPTVEIIELDGKTQTAVVKVKNSEDDFDHVRYKVMKPDTFQKNLATRKEAQFDGLMQYLQDYSFQELLANNNVVIIEPVRTKIEQISDKPVKVHRAACRITGGASSKTNEIKNGLKRHFFYHPVRVNKELIDEELPTPDTVRNVRKFFEGTNRMRASPSKENLNGDHQQEHGDNVDGKCSSNNGSSRANESLRKKTLRYLTIDTSFGNGNTGIRKWDSASLSSGISSGELSSPCDCTEHDEELGEGGINTKGAYSSEENLCDTELCDTHYVSQDVLEKIRERGSTVTYYGGRKLDEKSAISPMTKAIMQEIKGSDVKCRACQPHNCPKKEEIASKVDPFLNVKFKLVKSNSCSSRLQFVGTGKSEENNKNLVNNDGEKQQENQSVDQEQSVRALVHKLETGAILQKPVPRIIESKCIEKISDDSKNLDTLMTINNQLMDTKGERLGPVELITQVTVNNHISFCNTQQSSSATLSASSPSLASTNPAIKDNSKLNKVCRNKNVDLAFNMNTKNINKPTKEKENEAKKASQYNVQENSASNNNRKPNEKTFKDAKESLEMIKTINTEEISSNQRKIQEETTNAEKITILHQQISSTTTTTSTDVVMRRFSDNVIINDINTSVSKFIETEKGCKQEQHPEVPPHKMVKWGTLNKYDEKNYVANDAKLRQKKKYDEMEFEEFEVFDPNSECYDSLNSTT